MKLTKKSLETIMTLTLRNWGDTPANSVLYAEKSGLSNRELVALSYYRAIISFLVSKDYIKEDQVPNSDFIEVDSEPSEDDYL